MQIVIFGRPTNTSVGVVDQRLPQQCYLQYTIVVVVGIVQRLHLLRVFRSAPPRQRWHRSCARHQRPSPHHNPNPPSSAMSDPPVRWIIPHICVKGAGSSEVNGEYKLTGLWNDRAPVWSKTSDDGEIIVIYRDRQPDGLTFWYIEQQKGVYAQSYAQSLGTWEASHDQPKPTVFYCIIECDDLIFDEASTSGFRAAPPKYSFGDENDTHWRACKRGVEPCPKIELV